MKKCLNTSIVLESFFGFFTRIPSSRLKNKQKQQNPSVRSLRIQNAFARGHYKHVIQHSNTTCNYTYSVSFECDPTISLRFRFWPFNFFLKSFFTRRCFLCCLFFLSFAILKMNKRNTGH